MTKEQIIQNINNTITETNFNNVGEKLAGKVRDVYVKDDKIVLIATDRQSAFDRVLAAIPFKGQVLTQTSAWWLKNTKHIIDNFVIDTPDPNVVVGKKCKVFPIEFVVRGYLTGSTSTSAWVNYEKGVRDFCGNPLPEGMKKNEKFAEPIVTPTTKDKEDKNISPAEIVNEKWMTQEDWDYVSAKALELFKFGQIEALKRGLILVDTKYEFGRDADGNILLIDEIHTPDSSRYWLADSCEARIQEGKEPENIDKEFLRLWFRDNCDPYNDKELPEAPEELVAELSLRYIKLYEMITGEKFKFEDRPILERIEENLSGYAQN